ncbi:MAG: competence/damage-inducible protein A [Deltaproteobacteria bacterium]|nr:competence/damage-inducible protein A [Deltaproteobacteria bacterium]
MNRTAGIVVIGNEILSGKVTDTNSPFLARELRKIGVDVRRVDVIPDELDDIAGTVRDFRERFDLVFTSGGVGPTHDDVTIEGIARAFGRRVVREPGLEQKLRDFYKHKVNEARLKMSEVPEGAELIYGGSLAFPTIQVENVYILPGIPEILEAKFLSIRERFAADPFHLRIVYTREGEGAIAQFLNDTLRSFPALLLGSYPKIGNPEYVVKLTLESKDLDYVDRALAHLLRILPEGCVVKTESF